MTKDHLVEEKTSLQKSLLYYEKEYLFHYLDHLTEINLTGRKVIMILIGNTVIVVLPWWFIW